MGLKNVLVQGSELYFLFSFLKRLVTKFEKTDAYKLGIIDKNGKVLIKKRDFTTIEQRNAYTMMDTLIFNLKKLLGKIPFGKTTIATYAAALLLLREEKNLKILADEKILEEKFSNLYEDILHEWGEGDFLAEGDMEADREAGIKWVDDPDWKRLHNIDDKTQSDNDNSVSKHLPPLLVRSQPRVELFCGNARMSSLSCTND